MSRSFGSASDLEMHRRQAVAAVHQGDKVADVARIKGVGERTVELRERIKEGLQSSRDEHHLLDSFNREAFLSSAA